MIVSSFLSQYGLRIRTREFETVSWDEFKALIAGLAPETALGRIVAIRSETDKDIIEHFSPDQKRIYDDWRERGASRMSQEDYDPVNANQSEDARCNGIFFKCKNKDCKRVFELKI